MRATFVYFEYRQFIFAAACAECMNLAEVNLGLNHDFTSSNVCCYCFKTYCVTIWTWESKCRLLSYYFQLIVGLHSDIDNFTTSPPKKKQTNKQTKQNKSHTILNFACHLIIVEFIKKYCVPCWKCSKTHQKLDLILVDLAYAQIQRLIFISCMGHNERDRRSIVQIS